MASLNSRTAQKFATGAVALGAGASGAGAAQAAIVTITDSISINQLEVAGGGSLTGTFNINGLVAAGLGEPFDIISASATAFGYSDINYSSPYSTNYTGYQYTGGYSYTYYAYTYAYTYSYSCGWGSTCYSTYYTNVYATGYVSDYLQSHDVEHVDNVADQLTLATGSSSATGTASAAFNQTGGYTGQTLTSQSGGAYQSYYYDQARDVYSAVYGETDATLSVGADGLESLSSSGELQFAISVPTGQVNVNSVELTVTYDNTPVPEPVSIATLLTGISGIGFLRRRRKMGKTVEKAGTED